MKRIAIVLLASLLLPSVAGSQSMPDPATFALTATPPITLEYVGAFRLPRDMYPAEVNPNGYPPWTVSQDAFDFGGSLIGHDATTNSLVVSSRRNRIALVSIPAPSTAMVISDLPVAAMRSTTFIDPSGNTWAGIQDGDGYAGLGGGMVLGDRLFFSGYNFYDANNGTRRAFRVTKFPVTSPAVLLTPWRTVGSETEQGHIGGYFIPIPERHQAALGGKVCTGLQAVSIQFRTSAGPVCHAWDPEALLTGNAPAKMLVGYPSGHWTLGPWDGVNAFYGITTQIYGGSFVGDWLMFWGMHGLSHCYGNGTGIKALVGTKGADGEPWCYDPTTASKGNHGYPYQFQNYAYRVSELADVAAGKREPWSLTPIAWKVDQPFVGDTSMKRLGGVVEANGVIYVSQLFSDVDGFNSRALILVYKATAASVLPPITDPPPIVLPPPPVTPPSVPMTPDVDARLLEMEARIATIKQLIKQALNNTTAKGAVVPLKAALVK